MEFTTAQSDAIQNEGHTIITACPGAGKTRVLIERSARLLRSQTNNLALVTFTRAATEEMKVRISQRVQTKRASINTFHGFACRQFRTLRNGKKIASSIETRNAIWSAIRITKTKLTYDEAAGVIEQYNGQLYPNRLEQDDKHAWDVFNTYEKIMEKNNLVDLSQVTRNVVIGLREGDIHPLPVSHILVDEFQDIDAIQLAWVEEHYKRGTEITVVADDDQSIYAFRRSLGYEGIKRFEQLTKPNHFILDTCFRCPSEITDHASVLIDYNTKRVSKTVHSFKGPGGYITHVKCESDEEEGRTITKMIPHLRGRTAILARRNSDLDTVESMMRANDIACERITGRPFWDNEPAAMYLSLLVSLIDTSKLLGVTTTLTYFDIDQDRIHEYCDYLEQATSEEKPSTNRIIKNLHKCLLATQEAYRAGDNQKVANTVKDWLVEYYERAILPGNRASLNKANSRINVTEMAAKAIASIGGELKQNLLRLQQSKPQKQESNKDAIKLGTFHSSKGLEFNNVWLIQINEFDVNSLLPDDLEEERRLFYVAMTRAEDQLYISSTKKTPSLFVYQAGLIQKQQQCA
jgi:superfamily I DNA/RNA helicase